MKFDMSQAWRDATAMLSGNREVLLVVAGLFFLLPGIALALALGDVQQAILADPKNAEAMMLDLYLGWWWLIVVYMLAQIVGYLALLALLRDSGRPTVGEALKTGLVALLPAFAAYILTAVGLGLAIGLLAGLATATGSGAVAFIVVLVCIVVAVYVYVKVSLTGPVMAIDKVFNPLAALARSWRLTKGNSFRLFLFYALLIVVYFVISVVVTSLLGAAMFAFGQSTAQMVQGIVTGCLGALVTVVFVAVIAAIHRQLAGPSAAAVSQTFE